MITLNNEGNLAKLLVVGVGGEGNNAVNLMIDKQIKGVEYVVVNTDAQQLATSKASNKLQIGEKLTKGLGAGARPEIGMQAAEESKEEIIEAIKDYDMIFIAAGMGGGTGTGAAPVIAALARELGILTVAIVTKPFNFEGPERWEYAERGIAALKEYVDTLLVVPNEKIFLIIDKRASSKIAYAKANEVLQQAVEGISNIIHRKGVINLDFNDARRVMKDQGYAHIGVGRASGENKAEEAAKMAVNSPLLETSIEGATHMLVNFIASEELAMIDIKDTAEYITQAAGSDVNIIYGQVEDSSLGDDMIVMVIATGFDQNRKIAPSEYRLNPEKVEKKIEKEAEPAPVEEVQVFSQDNEDSAASVHKEQEIIIPEFLQRKRKKS